MSTHIGLAIKKMTGFDTACSGSRQGEIAPQLSEVQGMQPFQVVSQTNQGPLASGSEQAAQRKLAKAQHFLDDANHGFDRRFTQAIERIPNFGTQLVSHLLFSRSILCQQVGIVQEISTPTLMMGTASGGERKGQSRDPANR